ncbi:MAG: Cna B-type domain-containing protein, partial [Oscillospiraceae bacterium]|nr:Cna B-type domain-containing protein [Oscillospiraceae bacterium]
MRSAAKQYWKRAIALALVLSLALSLCFTTTFAADEDDAAGPEETTVYEVICGKQAHLHGSECYSKSCEYQDLDGHSCGQECYQLTCALEEHTHSLGCMNELGVFPKDEKVMTQVAVYCCEEEGHTHNFMCGVPYEAVNPTESKDPADEPAEGEVDGDANTPGDGENSGDANTPGDGENGGNTDNGEDSGDTTAPDNGEGSGDAGTPDNGETGDNTDNVEGGDANAPGEAGSTENDPPAGTGDGTTELPDGGVPLSALPVFSGEYCTAAEGQHIHGPECQKMIQVADPEDLVMPAEKFVAKINGTAYNTLSDAVSAAKAGDTIVLGQDVTESVAVAQNITIDLGGHTWTGSSTTTLSAKGTGVDSAVTVKNGKIVAGSAASSAKATAIHADNANLTIENCEVSGTGTGTLVRAETTSAKIHPSETLTISGSSFKNAAYGVYAAVEGNVKERSMTVNISNSTFASNTRGLYCGTNNSGSKPEFNVNVTGCTFEGNTTAGISIANNKNNVDNFKVDVTDTKFLNNTGSALKMESSFDCATVSITGGEISGNVVSYSSDSVIKVNGPFTMDGTNVSNNKAYLVMDLETTSAVTIQNASFTNNESTNSSDARGAIYVSANDNAVVKVNQSEFIGNSGRFGGALYVNGKNAVVNIDGSTFEGNTAKLYGGALYLNASGGITINDTVITDNTANSTVSKGTAYGKIGGGLYVANTTGTVTLSGSTCIYNNHTPGDKQVPGTNDGGSADMVLESTKVTSSTSAKNPSNFSHAELVLNNEKTFTGENGNKYTFTQFDRTKVNANGYYWYSGSNYYWPMGYYTTVEEPSRIYLGNEDQHTGDKATMTSTLAEAVKKATGNGADTVYVCQDTTITAEDAELLNNSGITFVRCFDHGTGHMFTIKDDITLDGAHIDGMSVKGDASLIDVTDGAQLTIAGDTIIENGKNTASKSDGGAITVGDKASLLMTGGIIRNNSARQGGGIYAFAGDTIRFEGGMVSNNIATGGNGGGGAYIWATSSEFGVYGGRTTFDGNKANQLGGGVFLVNGVNAQTHHYIYKATFTNNSSYRTSQYYDGGAIYIQSGTTAHMKNVYVSGNTDSDKAGNAYTAVAVCPTGKLAVYELDGLLAINNGKNPDIGIIKGGVIPETTDEGTGEQVEVVPKVYLPSNAPGGGEVKYTDKDGTVVNTADYQFIEGYFRLYTKAADSTIDAARTTAENSGVVITGNYATQYGSGIMTNGLLKIGTETTTLKVTKVWNDKDEDHSGDQILVYLTKDGDVVSADFRSDSTVILNEENNWTYTWTNLGNNFTWGVKEAAVGDYTPDVEVEEDTQFDAIADHYYIATITNTPGGDNNKLVIRKTAIDLDPENRYQFTLKLGGKVSNDQVFALRMEDTGELIPIYGNEVTFYLKGGQTAVVEGLPDGFTYELTEAEGEYSSFIYESVTANEGGAGQIYSVDVVNVSIKPADGIISGTKVLNGRDFQKDDHFTFEIEACPEPGKTDKFAMTTEDIAKTLPEKTLVTLYPGMTEAEVEDLPESEDSVLMAGDVFSFDLHFTKPGTYHYVVNEKRPESDSSEYAGIPGVTYDPMQYHVIVEVNMDENGELKPEATTVWARNTNARASWPEINLLTGEDGATIPIENALRFENTYNPAEITRFFLVRKILVNKDLKAGDFNFILTPGGSAGYSGSSPSEDELASLAYSADQAQPMPTVIYGENDTAQAVEPDENGNIVVGNGPSGHVTFDGIKFTAEQAGKVYKYTIREEIPAEAEYDETLGQYVLNGVAYSGKEVDLYIHVYIEETDPDTTGSTGSVVRAQVYGERGAAFVNTYSGSLTLRKTVTGVNGDQSRDWRFTVTLTDKNGHPLSTTVTANDGVDEMGVTPNMFPYVKNTAAGEITGYVLHLSEEELAVMGGLDAEQLAEMEKENILLMEGDTLRLTLKHNESITISGLPEGVRYTVTEEDAGQNGYTTTVNGTPGTSVSDGMTGVSAEVSFINERRDTTRLTVNKVWVGDTEASRPESITVALMRGDTPEGEAVTLTAENGWTYTWENLEILP